MTDLKTKICTGCGDEKLRSEFLPHTKGGVHSRCRPCKIAYDRAYYAKNRERLLENRRLRNQQYPEFRRDAALRHYYGITLADYDRMFEAQDGRCRICNRTAEEASEGRRPGGLLCYRCNGVLGLVADDVEILNEMLRYLA